jgi:FemAB-related protein (PEP-CTERM system-associated)
MRESATLRVVRLEPWDRALAQAWDGFVHSHPQATFFHKAAWSQVVRDVFGHDTHYLCALEDQKVVGVLPMAHVDSLLFGRSLTSLPFAVYGGLLAATPEAGSVLEAHADQLARQLQVDHLEFRNVTRRHEEWPLQDLYVTFRKEILPDEEANMLAIPRKQRAMVRKGIKNGLTSEIDAGVERFFALYADNVHRHGTPAMPRKYFQCLMDTFGRDCEVMTVCDAQGVPVSSVMSFYFRDEVLPYYAGDAVAARDLAANDFKYWELMRRACARGLKVFDYGRSKKETGSYAFKKNWGFEPQPLHYEYRLYTRDSIPQNNPSNRKYQFMIQAWRKMPIGLANWLGPFIVRNLG